MNTGRKFQVLIAEDDETDGLLLARACKAEGLANPPVIVQDGSGVIAYLQGNGIYADRKVYPEATLIFLDLKMPGMNGFDVLKWLQTHVDHQVIPTVVLSSSNFPVDVKLAYCYGANAFLMKPHSYDELRAVVRITFDFWQKCLTPAEVDGSLPSCPELMQQRHRRM
jgi:two-component system response regulator